MPRTDWLVSLIMWAIVLGGVALVGWIGFLIVTTDEPVCAEGETLVSTPVSTGKSTVFVTNCV